MFNFLVTAKDGAWTLPAYTYERSRFLEYTSSEIADRFQELKEPQLSTLQGLPCLFAYEGKDEPMRVGRLKSIKLRNDGRTLYLVPELDPNIPPIAFGRIEPYQHALDIRDWELNRTHWAIKDEDLFEVLTTAGVIPEVPAPRKLAKSDLPPPVAPSIRADSVGTFIETVLGLDHGGKEVFYRGHSNRTKYRLEPSIFRKNDSGDFLTFYPQDKTGASPKLLDLLYDIRQVDNRVEL